MCLFRLFYEKTMSFHIFKKIFTFFKNKLYKNCFSCPFVNRQDNYDPTLFSFDELK